MISWRNGKAAFIGASKYLIKGLFSYQHSVTSIAPIDTPDCFVPFIGHIDTKIGFDGGIDDQTNAFIGPIDANPTASIGVLFTKIGFIGPIDDDPNGFIGEIDDKIGFDGEICDC